MNAALPSCEPPCADWPLCRHREPTTCHVCGTHYAGDRRAARGARWEPFSNRSQWHLDHGPMICPDCVAAAVERVLVAMRERFGDPRALERERRVVG